MSPLTIVRLTGVFNAAVLVRLFLPLVFICFIIFLWEKSKKKITIDGFTMFLLGSCFYGVVVGLLRTNDLYFIVADTASIIIACTIYLVSQQTVVYPLKLKNIFDVLAYAMVCSESLTVFTGYFLKFIGVSFYMSLGNVMALFPFVWFLANKRYMWAMTMSIIIVLGGKVGVLLALLTIILIHILLVFKKKIKFLLVYGLVMLIAVNMTLFSIKDIKFSGTGFFGAALSKIQYQNPYRLTVKDIFLESDTDDLESYGGGRVREVVYSMAKLTKMNYWPIIAGGGHGFSYDLFAGGEVLYDVHNVHLSPISLLVKYGLILTISYYLGILLLFRKFYRYLLNNHNDPIPFALFYFCVGNFIFSFTAYSIFVVGVFWFFMGFLKNITSENKQVIIRVN